MENEHFLSYPRFDEFVKKSQKLQKCHAEPCAELVSVLFQHLIESNTNETLK